MKVSRRSKASEELTENLGKWLVKKFRTRYPHVKRWEMTVFILS